MNHQRTVLRVTWWQAVVLGVVQGLTEFLPVSSSGHLLLLGRFMGVSSPGMTAEVALHLGTLVAVLAVYRKDVMQLIRHPFRSDLPLLALATVPAVLAALLFSDAIDSLFGGRYLYVGFLLTSAVLLLSGRLAKGARTAVTAKDALCMGIAQALAILPGLSRSGSTIAAGLSCGLTREKAARFSFLMSVPAICGSLVLALLQAAGGGGPAIPVLPLLLGAACACAAGLIAIRFMLAVLMRRGLAPFALYTLALAVLAFVLG